MDSSISRDVRTATTWSIVLSALMSIAGLLAICVPVIAGAAVTAVVGWLLIFSGVLHFVFAWRAGRASATVWEILIGIVYGVLGYYLLARPAAGLAALTMMIAIYLMIKGAVEFILSFQLQPAPGSGWLLVDGVITLGIAVMIWSTWPSSAMWVIGTLVGVSMFFSGMSRLILSLEARRILT